MLKKISLLSICCIFCLLCGCGQSGPLYLPKEEPAQIQQKQSNQQTVKTPETTTNQGKEKTNENTVY
jgi:predicted small lipoprotein YifL